MSIRSDTTLMEEINLWAGLQEQLLASDENGSDDDQDLGESTSDPPVFYPMPTSESPLDHTGPIPAEYRRDPYAVEVFPMPPQNGLSASKPRLQIQERVLWASTVVVSWSITIVAILKVLGIL